MNESIKSYKYVKLVQFKLRNHNTAFKIFHKDIEISLFFCTFVLFLKILYSFVFIYKHFRTF